jgi:hypothetical protein
MKQIEWNRKWFGYWGGKDRSEPGWQALDDFVDPEWNPPDKDNLNTYLEQAPSMMKMESAGSAKCIVCGSDLGEASDHRSDGVWLWPAGLPHSVRFHSVVLPDKFVQHIRKRTYALPSQQNVDWMSLDWPGQETV